MSQKANAKPTFDNAIWVGFKKSPTSRRARLLHFHNGSKFFSKAHSYFHWPVISNDTFISSKSEAWEMVFCYQNCSDLLWEKMVLVIEKNFWNSRLKEENLQNVWDH